MKLEKERERVVSALRDDDARQCNSCWFSKNHFMILEKLKWAKYRSILQSKPKAIKMWPCKWNQKVLTEVGKLYEAANASFSKNTILKIK